MQRLNDLRFLCLAWGAISTFGELSKLWLVCCYWYWYSPERRWGPSLYHSQHTLWLGQFSLQICRTQWTVFLRHPPQRISSSSSYCRSCWWRVSGAGCRSGSLTWSWCWWGRRGTWRGLAAHCNEKYEITEDPVRSSKPLVWVEDVVGVGEVGRHAVGLGVDTGGGVEAQTGQGVVGGDQIHRTQILLIKKCKTVPVLCCLTLVFWWT